jgi:dihydrolipoamide dehydrogenase
MGIEVKPTLDLAAMLAFKDEGVKGNVDGVAYLLRKNKIDHFHGTGRIMGPGKVEVTFINGEKQVMEAKSVVIATGSAVSSRSASAPSSAGGCTGGTRNDSIGSSPTNIN